MKRWFKTPSHSNTNSIDTTSIYNHSAQMIDNKHILPNSQSGYFFRGDDLLENYYSHAQQLRTEIEELKPFIQDYIHDIIIYSKHATQITTHIDKCCDTAQHWPVAMKTFRNIHRHFHDSAITLFQQHLYDEIADVLNQWLTDCKVFMKELKHTNDNRSKRDSSKSLVDSLFEEKVEGRKEWTEEQERTLQTAKAQLGKECTVYDGMVAGLKSHFESLCMGRMDAIDAAFEHLLAQEFTLFRPLNKAIRHYDTHNDNNSADSPLPGNERQRSIGSPLSPTSNLAKKLRFNPLQRSRMFGDNNRGVFTHNVTSKTTLDELNEYMQRDVSLNGVAAHASGASMSDAALFETVRQLQTEILKREATEAEIQQLKEQITALQSASQSEEHQEQLNELRRQLDQPQSQRKQSIAATDDNKDKSYDDGAVVGSSAPPTPVVGDSAPAPPPLAPPIVGSNAPPPAPGAPPPPGPPPPTFTYGKSGLVLGKPGTHHLHHKPLTAREQEIQTAKQHNLPLLPKIEQSDSVLLKKIHWNAVPASDIKTSIWADIVLPNHSNENDQFASLKHALVPIETGNKSADSPASKTSDTTNNDDTTKSPSSQQQRKSSNSDNATRDLLKTDWLWELDESEFEQTFAQKQAVAMKRKVTKGKKYAIRKHGTNEAARKNNDESQHDDDDRKSVSISRGTTQAGDDDDSDVDSNIDQVSEDDTDYDADNDPRSPRSKRVSPRKSLPKIELVDAKRAYNVAISLSRFKMSYEELRDAVMNFNDNVLSLEMIDVLCEILPQPEEMKLVKSYTGNIDRLGDVEKFFLTMAVPSLASRLKSFVFLLSFSQLASSIEDAIEIVSTANNNISYSTEIRTLLGILLRLGNYLNAQNKLPQVYGFQLSTLSKIRGVKTIDNKSTLLHYVVSYINKYTPETRKFVDQLETCRPASRVEQAFLTAEVKQLSQNLRILDTLIAEDKRKTNSDGGIATTLTSPSANYAYVPLPKKVYDFQKYATERVTDINDKHKQLIDNYYNLSKLFLVSDLQWESFFAIWTQFVDEYITCEQDIEIAHDIAERKRKQAEAVELIKERQKEARENSAQNSNTVSRQSSRRSALQEALPPINTDKT